MLIKFKKFYFYLEKLLSHMKIKYNHTLIRGFNQEGDPKIIAIDESLFVHNQNGEAIWIIGSIETKERRIRLCFSKERKIKVIENFVNQNFLEIHILPMMARPAILFSKTISIIPMKPTFMKEVNLVMDYTQHPI